MDVNPHVTTHFLQFPVLVSNPEVFLLWRATEMKRRFERIYDVVESVEEYRHGGYHPVHLNDVFNHRYEIVGKLAYGQYSTVVSLASCPSCHCYAKAGRLTLVRPATGKYFVLFGCLVRP